MGVCSRLKDGQDNLALYLAVFPANVYQALASVPFEEGGEISQTALWLRLPFQLVLIAWALWVSRAPKR